LIARSSTRRRAGFTLLELLLAMGITVILSITLYASFNIMNTAKRRAEATVKPTRAVAVAMELISKDLENAVIPTVTSATTTVPSNLFLSGGFLGAHEGGEGSEADWVEFHTIASDSIPNAGPLSEGIRRVDWGVLNEGNAVHLVRQVNRNLLAPVEVEPEPQVICRDVKAFGIKYYDGYTWYDQWDSTLMETPLPLLVQVDLTVSVADARQNNASDASLYHVTRLITIPTAKVATTTTGTTAP
jgi:type II secretion system protein J